MNPYLSIVVGIGGDFTIDLCRRLVVSTINTARIASENHTPIELVIVEWNQQSRGVLRHVDWPSDLIPIRIIHTGDLHSRVPNPHGFRYFEWYPKNIGIRRARGEFVLSTNPDDLFTHEMFTWFAAKLLNPGHFYRANRHDTRDGHVYRIAYATGCYPPGATEAQIRVPHIHGCPWSPDMLHFNASGDFMLMSRDDWFRIRGNPERDYNHSVDGQTVWLAHTMGLKQIVLPYPFYHPDHVRTLNHAYAPEWDDKKPHTKQNDENWGFAGVEFEETVL